MDESASQNQDYNSNLFVVLITDEVNPTNWGGVLYNGRQNASSFLLPMNPNLTKNNRNNIIWSNEVPKDGKIDSIKKLVLVIPPRANITEKVDLDTFAAYFYGKPPLDQLVEVWVDNKGNVLPRGHVTFNSEVEYSAKFSFKSLELISTPKFGRAESSLYFNSITRNLNS